MVRTRFQAGAIALATFVASSLALVLVGAPSAQAAGVATMGASKTLSESFDGLGTGTTNEASATPSGVSFIKSNGTTTYIGNSGSSTTGSVYSYGATGASERALGELSSGSNSSTLSYTFTNDTGETISALQIAYNGEQWRSGGTTPDKLGFAFSTDGGTTYTDLAGLNLNSIINTGAGELNGNLAANRSVITSSIPGLNVAPGGTVVLRWTGADVVGGDAGLAVDDLAVAANGVDLPTAPIAPSCAGTFTAVGASGGSLQIGATDPDGMVMSAAITSAPVAGIALDPVTPATSNGGTLSATLLVAPGTALGTSSVTITFTNDDTPTAQTATCTIVVTVAEAARIHDIQGPSHLSPLAGAPGSTPPPATASVVGVPGIVTGKRSNGFYLQDPTPDADPATSEGIFVFTSTTPTVNVGDSVLVGGTVTEFRPTAVDGPNLSTTEIVSPTVTFVSPGNPLPATTVIGTGGRIPPTATIDADPTASVEESAHVFDVTKNAIDFYESMEGMLVTVNGSTVVDGSSPTVSNGEIPVLPAGVSAGTRSPRGAVLVGPYVGSDVELSNANPGRVFLDDEVLKFGGGTMPAANVGDTIATATGPLDYSFGNFKVEVTSPPVVTRVPLPREVGAAAAANGITVATYNVENLAPSDAQSKFNGLATQIVTNLQAPDIIVVEEIQDNDGVVTASPTAANLTWDKLIAAIAAAGGPAYSYRQIDPVAGADGGAPGGNIRQGFLYRTDRGLAFVDRPGGDATTATAVTNVAGTPQLSISPGRIAPTDPDGAWTASRKPLVGEFTYAGRTLFVVGNHFNSKGGDEPLFGRFQPPSRSSEVQRHKQATLVNQFVASITNIDPAADVIVAGDFNDFNFSETLHILEGTQLVNMFDTLPANEQYDYVFEGNGQTLDHILVTPALQAAGNATFDVVHVNAEYGDQLSDHDPELLSLTFPPGPGGPTPPNPGGPTPPNPGGPTVPPAGGLYAPTGPDRLLDTRLPAGGGRITPGTTRQLPLASAPGDAIGIVAQVTVVDPTHDGWLKVFPCGQPEPVSTAVNYKAGIGAWAGQVTIAAGSGAMCFSTYAPADLVVDRAGWLVPGDGAGYVPLTPHRLVDTRTGKGGTRVTGGQVLRVDPSSTPGWPTGPVAAAVVQLTAVDGPDPGFLRAFPCDQQMTDTSNVNTRGAGQYAYSSLSTVPLAADGTFCVYTYSTSDVVIDVNGAWAASASARLAPAVAPFRVVDTREGLGGTTIPAGGTLRISPAAWGGGAAAILNIVAVNASGPGFLTVHDCATPLPDVSNLNYPAAGDEPDGYPTSNAVQVKVTAGGDLCVFAYAGSSVDVVVDVSGQVLAAT